MKACVIQPPYSRDRSRADACFQYKLEQLAACDASMDIIVLPEYSDVPCDAADAAETLSFHEKYFDALMQACAETAKRCDAVVFVNALSREADGYRNTTFAVNRRGEIAGKYFKRHLTPFESETLRLAGGYTYEYAEPYMLELDGVRYAFLTCYDFYFYEAFSKLAQGGPDVIIGCALQRSDSHDAIEIMCRFLAYNTNAYVIRASVSFSEDADVCGASMIVAPDGKTLVNMRGSFGAACAEFDPQKKHLKSAGFGNPPAAHHAYAEYGRRPWFYRPAGPAATPSDRDTPYPRVCAHRGFNTIAPENSLPAYGAAVALGADEIEFDVWSTKDGVLVSSHDDKLDRVSTGTGRIYEHTYAELLQMDFGVKHGEKFAGLQIPRFEEILRQFAGRVIMNIHVKIWGEQQENDQLEQLVALIRRYDCARHAYFMTDNDDMIRKARAYAPDIACCVGWDNNPDPMNMPRRAIAAGAQKVQFFSTHVSREAIAFAHQNGIICNLFFADDPAQARRYLDMGIDTILTNDYNLVAQAVKQKKNG